MKFFSSIKLAIVNIVLFMILVVFGTIAQIYWGSLEAQEKIFRAFFIFWQFDFLPKEVPVFPGGYAIGVLFALNLFSSMLTFSGKRLGIYLIHFGILFLLVGEVLSGIFSSESFLSLKVGEKKSVGNQAPFQVELVEFRQELHPGTNIPKHYSSYLLVFTPEGKLLRVAFISMNQPFRFLGQTLYQAGFTEDESILKVVSNPFALSPYLSCLLVLLGFLTHFFTRFFVSRRVQIAVACMVFLPIFANAASLQYLPVQQDGRIKPLDTVARNSLLMLHGSQSLKYEQQTIAPIDWLLDVLMNSKKSKEMKLIRVENLDLLRLLESKSNARAYYSISELQPKFNDLFALSSLALQIEEKARDSFQRAVITLWQQIEIYLRLANSFWIAEITNIPEEFLDFQNHYSDPWHQERYQFLSNVAYFQMIPFEGQWLNMGEALLSSDKDKRLLGPIEKFVRLISDYQQGNPISILKPSSKISFEVFFNRLQPFYIGIFCYLSAILLSAILKNKIPLWVFVGGFLIHTFGLFARMYLEGRPPVTNLYSSALFVGWAAVLMSLGIEFFYRNRLGLIAGAVVGSLTLLIAHHFSFTSDTMQPLRAVLNSNFWLSTHVVAITLGYSATFLAGTFGTIWILGTLFSRKFSGGRTLETLVYGIICFSAFFSFLGTVLGGFWADQSWGRFWGWDPKENGALLIILWNLLILHARLGGLIQARGLMVLSVFGNVVTAFSWFGVNFLSIGLHSYGFTSGSFLLLFLFVLSQGVVVALGGFVKKSLIVSG